MKRYQEIEFERHYKNTKSFLKKLQAKHQKFFEVWGEVIEFNFNQGITCEIENSGGYILHTVNDEDFYYVSFIATSEQQIIIED